MQLDSTGPPSSGIVLEVESRNFDGTVGATLFSNFSSSFDSMTGVVTFLANAPFELTAGTGYWLVLSDSSNAGVKWKFTSSLVYQSELSYGLPSINTSWISTADNGMGDVKYFQPSDGPQIFELITVPAVGQPSSLVLMGLAVAIGVLAMQLQGSRASRRPRPPVARGTKVVHPWVA